MRHKILTKIQDMEEATEEIGPPHYSCIKPAC